MRGWKDLRVLQRDSGGGVANEKRLKGACNWGGIG